MKIHVYDTHVNTSSGEYIHFDVLVNDENVNNVVKFVESYLAKLGVSIEHIKQSRCDFCHSEMANPEVKEHIKRHGHSILRFLLGSLSSG